MQRELTHFKLVSRQLLGVVVHGLTLRDTTWFPILDGADLSFARMESSSCENASFRGARLDRANFKGAVLKGAKFGVANASYASFENADLKSVEFIHGLFEGTDFKGANLSNAGFAHSVLFNANFEGALVAKADFSDARFLTAEMLEKAFGTIDTLLPQGVIRPSHWCDDSGAYEQWRDFRTASDLRTT